MPARAKSVNWLITQLKKEKENFDDQTYPLSSSQVMKIQPYSRLLKEDAQSLKAKSKQRRSVRLRVRSVLRDILSGIAQEVFFLCILAVPITTLYTVDQDALIPSLRAWWKHVSHPLGLTRTCQKYSVTTLLQDGLIPHTSEDHFDENLQSVNASSTPLSIQPLSSADSSHLETTSLSSDQPEKSILRFNFTDLLDFFKEHQDGHLQLQMVCSYEGVPLPYVNMDLGSSLGCNGVIEFSYELSTAFIRYIERKGTRKGVE